MTKDEFGDKLVIIIQARRSSTRLDDKILLPVCGKEILVRMTERVNQNSYKCRVVVATTNNKRDDKIVEICERENISVFRGSEINLLDRHCQAALKYGAEIIAKIPSDCPLIDPRIIDKVFDYFVSNYEEYDFVSNLHPATYPDGNDVEVMKIGALLNARKFAYKPHHIEHTTPYIWDNPDKFSIGNVEWETGKNFSMSHRFTLDYFEDYLLIKKIYEDLYPDNPSFGLNDILSHIERNPEIIRINKKYAGVNWYRHHIKSLKTISPEQTKII
ncbi:MAG: glycosyltransferase family protein [Bacteroidetes bacterium]|nr:glycosyltransferase family protein [Bacteroidota bacterium]